MDDFLFVPVSGAEAARGRGAANSQVRARVAQIRHAQSRHAQSAAQRVSKKTATYRVAKSRAASTTASRKQPKLQRNDSASTSEGPTSPEVKQSPTSDYQCTSMSPISPITWPESPLDAPKLETPVLSFSTPDTPTRQYTDPFWTYDLDYDLYLGPFFAEYVQNIALTIPAIDGPGAKLYPAPATMSNGNDRPRNHERYSQSYDRPFNEFVNSCPRRDSFGPWPSFAQYGKSFAPAADAASSVGMQC